MSEVLARMTVAQLTDALDRFISDNSHSRDLDDRWLASELMAIKKVADCVQRRNLGPDIKAKVNAFRASEIEKEMDAKRRELESLERQHAGIQRDLKAMAE